MKAPPPTRALIAFVAVRENRATALLKEEYVNTKGPHSLRIHAHVNELKMTQIQYSTSSGTINIFKLTSCCSVDKRNTDDTDSSLFQSFFAIDYLIPVIDLILFLVH